MSSGATKAKIYDALIRIMETVPLEKISVSDVAREAKVSRQTFYYHFDGMYDIFDWQVTRSLTHPDGKGSGIHAPSPSVCVIDLCEYFKANRDIVMEFRRVFYDKFAMKVRCYLFKVVYDCLIYLFPPDVNKNDLNVLVRFLGDGYVGVITRWFKADMTIDIREVFKGVYAAMSLGTSVDIDIVRKALENIDENEMGRGNQ